MFKPSFLYNTLRMYYVEVEGFNISTLSCLVFYAMQQLKTSYQHSLRLLLLLHYGQLQIYLRGVLRGFKGTFITKIRIQSCSSLHKYAHYPKWSVPCAWALCPYL
jgi:hypothetical protein